MRKFLCCLAFVVAVIAGLGSLPSRASAEIACSANATEGHLLNLESECSTDCKAEKDPKKLTGCKALCKQIHDVCLKKLQDAQKKLEDDHKKDMACRSPIFTCLKACVDGGKKLAQCGSCAHGEPLEKFQKCLKS